MDERKTSCRYYYSGGSRISQRGRETPTPDFGVRTYYYRPQTKFAKVMFYTCLSFCSQVGVYMRGGFASRWVCIQGGLADPLPIGYYRIRSTSGRYASYWNAFFFYISTGPCVLTTS